MLRLNFILNVYKEIFEKNDTAIAARSLIQRDIPWNINNSSLRLLWEGSH